VKPRSKRRLVKILSVSKDGMSAKVKGPPLPKFLQDLMIVGADGRSRGRLKGIVFYRGKTLVECIKEAIPAGCDVIFKPRRKKTTR
jgi:hypothetical protein